MNLSSFNEESKKESEYNSENKNGLKAIEKIEPKAEILEIKKSRKKPPHLKASHKKLLSFTPSEIKQLEEVAGEVPIATFIKARLYDYKILKAS